MKTAVVYQSNYSYVTKLYGPINDARIMSEMFKKLKYDNALISTKKPIAADTDIVFLSGHGTIINGQGTFLCPQKTRKRILTPNDYYVGSDLPPNALIILDSCFAGRFKGSTGKAKTINNEDYLRSVCSKSTNEFIHSGLLASTSNSYAQDIQLNGTWHGAFTLSMSILFNLIKAPLSIESFMDSIQKILYTLDVNQQTEYRILDQQSKAVSTFNQLITDIVGG